ncbi:hypothetical protein PILCRDRAFT_829563, partial [Piloderma croceum F 1598]
LKEITRSMITKFHHRDFSESASTRQSTLCRSTLFDFKFSVVAWVCAHLEVRLGRDR